MADLSQNQPPSQSQTPNPPADSQPATAGSSFPPTGEAGKPITPEQEKIKKKLSGLGISPKGKSKKSRVLLATLGVLFLIATLPAAVYLVRQRQEIRKEAGWICDNVSSDCCTALNERCNFCNGDTPGNVYCLSKTGNRSCPGSYDYFCSSGAYPYETKEECEAVATGYETNNCSGYEGSCWCESSGGEWKVKCQTKNVTCEKCRNCGRTTETPTLTPTPTLTLTPTPTSGEEGQCEYCKVYDTDWVEITDLSTLAVDQAVYFGTRGSPAGITKARFRINDEADESWCDGTGRQIVDNWCETTAKHGAREFYIEYTIPSTGSYQVGAMVYNPGLGWF